MITVQTEGCAPIVRAFHAGEEYAGMWEDAETLASGLRVPAAFADREILSVLRESDGDAIAVSDAELLEATHQIGADEGIYSAPESGATIAAVRKLVSEGRLDPSGTILTFFTGSAYKYVSGMKQGIV
jgi:threonine synthase